MTTSDAFAPDYRLFRIEGRLWCELRGFWDVKGDFMGGPFVSYTTVDTENNRVFTLDCYVYAPDLNKPRKRNYMRGLEHLLYTVTFPDQKPAKARDGAADQSNHPPEPPRYDATPTPPRIPCSRYSHTPFL